MTPENWWTLIHPAITVLFVFPMIGIVTNFAWQTRQRRLQTTQGKSKIPPTVGREHVQIGRWLTGGVVGVSLVGLAYAIVSTSFIKNGLWEENPTQAILIMLMFVFTIACLVLLYRARQKHWRGIFATLTGMGLIIIGAQDGVFRRTGQWHISHYYYGIAASLLMIFSLAIVQDIYQDRQNRWRYVHIALNCFALLLFIGLGITGVRDLFQIALYLSPQ